MKKVFNIIFFYAFLIPLSLLPLWILYSIADFIAFLLKEVIKYRKQTIEQNLKNSFPESSNEELKTYKNIFYKHLADIFIEAFKALTISKRNVLKRYKCNNPELIEPYFKDGKSILLLSSHYNNWEYMVLSLGMQFSFHGIGVGKRMSNKSFEYLMHKRRTRFGTEVCYNDNVKEVFKKYEKEHKSCAYMLLSDQSPNDTFKSYWTNFLNQDTPVIFGGEYFAKKYNYPVFYYKVNKERRGYYSFDIVPLSINPQEEEYSQITLKYVSLLEKTIEKNPPFWLWSHKRWKHKRPEKIYQDTIKKEMI
jgi:KDO2-lipid IV(A) lauroyltransferase